MQLTEILEKVSKKLGPTFEFRPWQKEAVLAICKAYTENPEGAVILDAPTGTGKSIVAILSSLVFEEIGLQGYILASDISLQEQYESDISRFALPWGSVKGVDNYTCNMNGEKFSLGECRLRNLSYEKAANLECHSTCGYFQSRIEAIESKVSLLNYSYWLVQRNYVEKKMTEENKTPPFLKRNFIFFDEAHKVDEIVQSHFTPRIEKDFHQKLSELRSFLRREGFEQPRTQINNIKEIEQLIFREKRKESLMYLLRDLEKIMMEYVRIAKSVKGAAEKEYGMDISMPSAWKRALKLFDWVKDIHCKLEDYNEIIKKTSHFHLVKSPSETEVSFQCLDERHLLLNHFHGKAPFRIFMSATFGNPARYSQITAIDGVRVIRMSNGFNYEKSPIYSISKYRLSYKEREKNLPKVIKILDQILNKKHQNERGIIHAGSYAFAKAILEQSENSERLIKYENSKEKKDALQIFYESENGILIGPSLLEGLDLSDDKSRFQVFFKVPFPSLGDPLTSEKLNLSREWYDWKTTIGILQGVGRSVRNKEDWAVTYLLDGCFEDLLRRKDYFPPEFMDRIKRIG
jgi:Rad3-related DNA helicase